MPIDKLINVLVTITLVELMVAIGLGVTFADVIGVARNWRLVAQAALANYVCVPAAAVGLLLLFRAEPMVAAGFLIAAVCPGAPYGPPFTAMAKGNVAVSVGLMVILAGSSALVAPLLLYFLLPVVSGSDSLNVDAAKMVVTLLVTQLLPLCVGLTVRQWRPNLAARLLKPANLLSMVLNLSVIGLILVVHFQTLTAIRPMRFRGDARPGPRRPGRRLAAGHAGQRQPQGHGDYDFRAQRRASAWSSRQAAFPAPRP